jgi:hypothetical protein
MDLKTKLAKNYVNFRGWRTKRKLVVIESDDWGSLRLANEQVLKKIKDFDQEVANSKRVYYDGLERKEDLELLFEILCSFKDKNNSNPVITAITLTSNPNFDEIKKNMSEFSSELITTTYQKYSENDLFAFWVNEGIKKNILFPQFHGKEHLHPERYLKRIIDTTDVESLAFQNNSVFGKASISREKDFLAAFEYHKEQDKNAIENRTKEGLIELEQLFGFKSKSFCPSQSIYGEHLFEVLKNNGVEAIQVGQQFEPFQYKLKKIDHYWGDTTENGLVFWRRNCTFEPYKGQNTDHINDCLKEIEIAFKWGKPAVINSHRINYTSRLRTDLRDRTLKDLTKLLKEIIKRWPEVEFVNSSDLTDIITFSNK